MGLIAAFQAKLRTSPRQRLFELYDEGFGLKECENVLRALAEDLLRRHAACGEQDERLLRAHLMCEELSELVGAMNRRDEVEALDGLADLLYVVLGTAVTLDLPLWSAFVEVHASNMTKERQEGDGDRVLSKGSNYAPPALSAVLNEYRRDQCGSHSFDPETDVDQNSACTNCGMTVRDVLREQIDQRGRGSCKGGAR